MCTTKQYLLHMCTRDCTYCACPSLHVPNAHVYNQLESTTHVYSTPAPTAYVYYPLVPEHIYYPLVPTAQITVNVKKKDAVAMRQLELGLPRFY